MHEADNIWKVSTVSTLPDPSGQGYEKGTGRPWIVTSTINSKPTMHTSTVSELCPECWFDGRAPIIMSLMVTRACRLL